MRKRQAGFSLIELLIVVAIILIIAAISIPNLMSARMSANEAAAVGAVRTLHTACATYNYNYGTGFPATLGNLGPAVVASAAAADLIDGALVIGTKSGYVFTYAPAAPDANGMIDSYTLNADPFAPGQTGVRHFYTDPSGAITYAFGGAAGPADVPIS
jgi:prepilin-type N-terminal cleavage/methylation domain-containing protein